MKPTAISTPQAPAAIGPYSQGIRCGDWLFLSGQIPLDPETGVLQGSNVSEQTNQVMKNITAILKSQGLQLSNVLKATVFLKNMSDFPQFNEAYQKHLTAPFPARSTVEVARLPKDALVEVEVIAYCSN